LHTPPRKKEGRGSDASQQEKEGKRGLLVSQGSGKKKTEWRSSRLGGKQVGYGFGGTKGTVHFTGKKKGRRGTTFATILTRLPDGEGEKKGPNQQDWGGRKKGKGGGLNFGRASGEKKEWVVNHQYRLRKGKVKFVGRAERKRGKVFFGKAVSHCEGIEGREKKGQPRPGRGKKKKCVERL